MKAASFDVVHALLDTRINCVTLLRSVFAGQAT
jgi:hypothetical protein